MPAHLQRDPDVIVYDILYANLDPTQLSIDFSVNDDLSTGRGELPARAGTITIELGEENVVGGGTSGQTSMHGGGQGAGQFRLGMVYVDCWAGSEDDHASLDPQDVREEMAREVHNALSGFYQGTSYDGYPELQSLAPINTQPLPTDTTPPEYGMRIAVQYSWTRFSAPNTTTP